MYFVYKKKIIIQFITNMYFESLLLQLKMKCVPLNEWHIKAPWGKIRLTSWGNPDAPPVFLCHGRQDTSATFLPILELLDLDMYYYVAIDMPGSSSSDPFPIGIKLMRFHFLGAMEVAIEHLEWDKFIFIGHSMGCELALFFNAVYPGRITKMIFFDAELTLRRLQFDNLSEYQSKFYDDYYNNYQKDNYYYRTYTIEQAKQAIMRARNLPAEKAAIIMEKSLIHVAGDQYRFTWDRRLKLPAPQNYGNCYYFSLFKNIPDTLLISASETLKQEGNGRKGSQELLDMMATLEQFNQVVVEGNHDVHLCHPERLIDYINEFLRNNKVLQSKL